MSFLKKLVGVAAPVIGGMLGGPAGAAAGAGISGYLGASEQNKASAKAAEAAQGFSAAEALRQREWASAEASTARQFNELQAQKQMDFQERLANSAHQREVADLRAAGLNPILSGTGGMGSATPVGASAHASAPSGSAATGQKADVANVLGSAISSAVSSALAASQVEKQAQEVKESVAREADYRSQVNFRDDVATREATQRIQESVARTTNTEMDTWLTNSKIGLTDAQKDHVRESIKKIGPEINELVARMRSHWADAQASMASADVNQQRSFGQWLQNRVDYWADQNELVKLERMLNSAGIAAEAAKDIVQAFVSKVGREVETTTQQDKVRSGKGGFRESTTTTTRSRR